MMWPRLNMESIGILLNPICNIGCDHCFLKMTNFKGWRGFKYPNVNIQKLFTLLNEVADVSIPKPLKVFFYGGETLEHLEFIKYFIKGISNKNKFKFCLTTSGIYFNKDIISFFNEYDFHVNYSYDLYHAQKLNYDVFDKYKDYVLDLNDVRINWCIHPEDEYYVTLKIFEQILNHYRGNKLDFTIAPILFNENFQIYNLKEIDKGTKQLIQMYKDKVPVAVKVVDLIQTINTETKQLYGENNTKVCQCGPYPCSFYIDGNLDVFNCVLEPKKIGTYMLPINHIIANSVAVCDRHIKCSKCKYNFICIGGCKNIISNHICEVMHIYYNNIFSLFEKESN